MRCNYEFASEFQKNYSMAYKDINIDIMWITILISKLKGWGGETMDPPLTNGGPSWPKPYGLITQSKTHTNNRSKTYK